MSKIKINLANGTTIEKPLVTCFKGTNGNYIILDNETNGQMGYPIICISKFNGTSVEKVTDQGEWASVKENLKTIIAGTALQYLTVPETLTAPDDFFTQLTLPVASFDLLKKVYAPAPSEPSPAEVSTSQISPVVETTPTMPETPLAAEPTVLGASPVIAPAPIADTPETASAVAPAMAAPIIDSAINVTSPVVEQTPVDNENVIVPAPIIDPVVEMPQTQVAPENSVTQLPASDNDIQALKETFMKSCENMFDALIKKLDNK